MVNRKPHKRKAGRQETGWTRQNTMMLALILGVSALVGIYLGIAAAIATFVALSGALLPKRGRL